MKKPMSQQLNDLDKAFLKAAIDLRGAIFQGMTAATIMVQSDAVRRAPKKWGNLKKSISKDVTQKALKTTGRVGTPIKYAPFMEFGTSRIPGGRPFLIPALESNIRRIKDFITAAIKKVTK